MSTIRLFSFVRCSTDNAFHVRKPMENGEVIMKSEKPDRRVQYTKMVLKQSLLELMVENPISKITIKDLCDLADVNRGTFYTHYSDQYDLLHQIQDEMDRDIKAALTKNPSDALTVIVEILNCIAAQSSLCKILFSDYGDAAFIKKIMYNAHDQFIDEWKTKVKSIDTQLLNRFYIYTANGISAVIQDWLQNGMNESPQEIASFIEKSISNGLSAFLNKS